ncbi:ATP-dependent RNA helicase dbp10 [Drechslerella dactyloides]|uniref:RNA helicase n=1 Tax=Drechslerella dactyloides TaxID=74499 RepID=A0AAD6NIA9_DREDA|nr:ATP-dependent RNA helicase dbp10 [Drechslerella dactyloides]
MVPSRAGSNVAMAPRFLARAASPAASEADVDIASALTGTVSFADDDDFGFAEPPKKRLKSQKTLDASSILDLDRPSDNDDDASDDDKFIKSQLASANRKASNIKSKSLKKSGGFQSMGLNATLLKAIQRKGFSVPTPIQRKTIPLLLEGQDVVGMARTGSGKTAAFIIPMIEKLKAHSAKVGARGLILSPSRELALQTLKVVKDLSRGTDLKPILLVGGDSLEEQFSMMTTNPDIIIATPGRFLHLKVEMELDLGSIQYIVFDEADRLFEMGFAAQLGEILHALPANRQTTLFSATLPKSLVEFAKAGLHEPSLVRLDADSKVSTELESVFFSIKTEEKEGALLQILQDLINVPVSESRSTSHKETQTEGEGKKKRKRFTNLPKNELSDPHSTIIFASTKHHVEYLANLLKTFGYAVSYVYGTLDQVARRNQVDKFRSGESQILVVTDVAARGIDIPMLSNVINYDFPPQPKVFVHRVGRTARAGRRGWAYSLVRLEDMPYLLDLQLFLGRKLVTDGALSLAQGKKKEEFDFANDVIIGALKRDGLERCTEAVVRVVDASHDLAAMKQVAARGEKLYQKTKVAASTESVKRSKEIVAGKEWMSVNPIFADEVDVLEIEKADMLKRLANYRPQETVFEIGQRGVNRSEGASVMKARREKIKIKSKLREEADTLNPPVSRPRRQLGDDDDVEMEDNTWEDMDEDAPEPSTIEVDMSSADEDELESVFKTKSSKSKSKSKSFQDPEHYMAYTPTTSLAEDRGYSITNSFAEAARSATMDLVNDEGTAFGEPSKRNAGLRWDAKTKKFVNRRNDDDGSRGGPKMIRGESGQKIAASFKSGRFEGWKKANKLSRLPKVGELENTIGGGMASKAGFGGVGGRIGGRMFHKKVAAPKQADKARDDYHVRKKRVEEAKAKGLHGKGYGKRVNSEVKNNVQIAKDRRLKEKRREKNARPSRRGRK